MHNALTGIKLLPTLFHKRWWMRGISFTYLFGWCHSQQQDSSEREQLWNCTEVTLRAPPKQLASHLTEFKVGPQAALHKRLYQRLLSDQRINKTHMACWICGQIDLNGGKSFTIVQKILQKAIKHCSQDRIWKRNDGSSLTPSLKSTKLVIVSEGGDPVHSDLPSHLPSSKSAIQVWVKHVGVHAAVTPNLSVTAVAKAGCERAAPALPFTSCWAHTRLSEWKIVAALSLISIRGIVGGIQMVACLASASAPSSTSLFLSE